MLLAAGLGTRLRPLTLERAKPAIPLLGKPLVLRLVERLIESGASAFRVNLHHLPDTIRRVFEGKALPISFSFEPEILGTAGGLAANEAFFDQGTFLMVNGDIVMDFDLREALAFHRERRALATLVLIPQQPPYRYTQLKIDSDYRITGLKGSRTSGSLSSETYVFTGVHILEPEIFSFIPPGVFYEINDQVYPEAIGKGLPVYGFPVDGYWNDLGSPARYLEAQRDLFKRGGITPSSWIASGATVEDQACLGPLVSAEDGVLLERRSFAEYSILWRGARVTTGALLRNCIVGSGVTVTGTHENKVITLKGEAPIA